MKYCAKKLSSIFGGLLLLVIVGGSAQAQRPPYGQRGNSYVVYGTIKWRKDKGVIPMGPGHKQAAVYPCMAFFVAATDPGTGKAVSYTSGLLTQGPDEGDYYVCQYSLKVPGDRSLYMIPGMGGVLLLPKMDESAYYWTDAWIGGSRNKPPGGMFRTFTGYAFVRLHRGRPRASVSFEMIYANNGDPR